MLSRYDISTGASQAIATADQTAFSAHISSDGRYYYFGSGSVAGVPGGAVVPGAGHEAAHHFGPAGPTAQIYRYDSARRVIQCVSCASDFAPEPKLGSYFGGDGASSSLTGTPRLVFASSNGDYAFFQSTAALVKQDVDGEVAPEGEQGVGATGPVNPDDQNSISGDVYEWRAAGVTGCVQVQGCLALLTNGRGGYLNELLGTADEGRDVFIYTSSALVGRDSDTAGDIYDVRIGGGFPEPPPPVECEGDSCATPLASPTDPTPSSATFQGAGNLLQQALPVPAPKPKPHKACKRTRHKKCHRARRTSHRARHAVRKAGHGRPA